MASILRNREPIIDPELRDLLPPIMADERKALTADELYHSRVKVYSRPIQAEGFTAAATKKRTR